MNLVSLGVAVGLYMSAALATPGQNRATTVRWRLPASDITFMNHEFQEGIVQIRAGKLAQQRAVSPAIRDFAGRMVAEHSRSNRQLESLATSKGPRLPALTMDAEQRAVIDRLSALKGAAFDRAYVRTMRSEHSKAVAAFERESRVAINPELRRWITDTLPALRDHERMAMNLPMQGYAHRTFRPWIPFFP